MYSKLLDMAKYHGADYEDAKDAVQDFFLKLSEIQQKEGNLDRLEYNGKMNLVYMFNAMRNIVYNKHRKNERIQRSGLLDATVPPATLHEVEVNEHLKTLDPFCQKLYSAYMQDNISMRELSKKTNISVTTIFYGVKNIRETLKEIFYES